MFTTFKKNLRAWLGIKSPCSMVDDMGKSLTAAWKPIGHQKDCEKHRYDDEGLCYCILEMKHIPMDERHESLRCDDCIHHNWTMEYWKEEPDADPGSKK